jgi:hypothetical protein
MFSKLMFNTDDAFNVTLKLAITSFAVVGLLGGFGIVPAFADEGTGPLGWMKSSMLDCAGDRSCEVKSTQDAAEIYSVPKWLRLGSIRNHEVVVAMQTIRGWTFVATT